MIADLLFAGKLTLTGVRLLGPHLTSENHEAVLARAAGKSRGDVALLVAEIAPRPDVAASVRKLPALRTESVAATEPASGFLLSEAVNPPPPVPSSDDRSIPLPAARPIIEPLAPQRYRVQFTIGQETHDRLGRIQSLMRREIPGGDVAAIFDRALELLEQAARAKVGFPKAPSRMRGRPRVTAQADSGSPPPADSGPPASDAAAPTYETRIRFETYKPSRHVPNAVRSAVWQRDQGQCAFVGTTGHRCAERNFLEFHHIQPYALGGAASAGNISLRCRRHNALEAEMVFGPRGPSTVSEMREVYQGGMDRGRSTVNARRFGRVPRHEPADKTKGASVPE